MLILFWIVPVLCLQSKSYQEVLEFIQNDPDHLALMLFIKDDNIDSNRALSILEEYAKTVYDIVNIQVINCDSISEEELTHLPACQHKESLPFAMYIIPPKEQNLLGGPVQPSQKLLTNFSIPSLQNGFLENSPQFWELINDEQEYNKFLSDKRLNKVLTRIATKPLWWYGITQLFRDRLDFAVVNSRLLSKDLIILKVIHGEYVEQSYNGAMQYQSLRSFLSTLSNTQRLIRNLESSKISDSQKIHSIQSLHEINFQNQWVLLTVNNHSRTQQIIQDMKGIFDVYSIENITAEIPQLLVYPFTSKKNRIQIFNQNPLQLCLEMMDYLTFNLNTDVLKLLKDVQSLITQKNLVTIWFLNEKTINRCHLMWALTFANNQLYKKVFSFHLIFDPEDQIRKQFKISKLPTITSLQITEGQVAQIDYDGIFEYQSIENYIDKIFQKHQIENKQSQQYPKNQKEFEFLCSQQVYCIIGIIEKDNKVDEDVFIKAMKTVNNNQQIWIILYKECSELLLKKFNLKAPSLIVYNRNEYQYLIMKDRFTFLNIERVAKSKKYKWKELDFEIEIEKCFIKDEL